MTDHPPHQPHKNQRSIGVFCGSGPGNHAAYLECARAFGRLAAEHNVRIVYGGGGGGMMGAVADAALQAGGQVTGVIPAMLVQKERAHRGVADMRIVQTMAERKEMLLNLSDALAVLPGGLGTADELYEALTWSQLGLANKPTGIVNLSTDDNDPGFFSGMIDWIARATDSGFIHPDSDGQPIVEPTPDELFWALIERLDAIMQT